MHVNGKWIGYGRGDVSPEVARIQHRLLKAYPVNSKAPALGVTESGSFDQATEQAVKNFQATVGLPATGVANADTQVRMGAYMPAPNLPSTRPTFITVNGTGSPDPFGPGFAGEVGQRLDPKVWYWQPIAYPAATFPMGPSVQAGRAEVNRQIAFRPPGTPIGLAGYSQGALVTDTVWRDDILSPRGMWHSRYLNGDFNHAIVNFGDPMRAAGICHGNEVAGFPVPAPLDGVPTGGIAGTGDLTAEQTPAFLLSCNNDGDLYGAAPVGSLAGGFEESVFNIVQDVTINNLLAIGGEVLEVLNPARDVIDAIAGLPVIIAGGATNSPVVGLIEALVNGGMFVVSGFGPHGDYEKMVPAMVDYVMAAGRALS